MAVDRLIYTRPNDCERRSYVGHKSCFSSVNRTDLGTNRSCRAPSMISIRLTCHLQFVLPCTGHCWPSTYAKPFRFQDNDRCFCGNRETDSCSMDSPNLRDLRRELRGRVGDTFGSVSCLLGGSQERGRGKPDNASRAKTVEAMLDFAEVSQRFRSRAP